MAWPAYLVAFGVVAVLGAGWHYGGRLGVTPDHGLGYWLGIVGGTTILAVLAYPLRKYWRRMRNFGTVTGWFTTHMLLGTLGPAIVLLHSNFQLGPLNSNIALFSMLLVAGSGVIGRYLYGKIHYGLHGKRAELSDMVHEAAAMRRDLGGDLPENSPLWSELLALEELARRPSRGVLGALWHSLSLSTRAANARSKAHGFARRFIQAECKRHGLGKRERQEWQRIANRHLASYFFSVTRISRLILWERLFALWHLAHVPLFVVMAFSVVVHIVAVHFY
jgi:hypothetical protein